MSTLFAHVTVLKVSNIPEVKFEHYRTYICSSTYICMYIATYVRIASTELQYGSTDFVHVQ